MASWLPCPRRATEVIGAAWETATGKMPIQDGALPPKHGALGVKIWHLAPLLGGFRAGKTGQKPTKNRSKLAPDRRKSAPAGGQRLDREEERGQKDGGQKNVPAEEIGRASCRERV